MHHGYNDCTGPEDDPMIAAARRETTKKREELVDELDRAKARLKDLLDEAIERLHTDRPMAYEVFMKRNYETELTKERRPKNKSFRKIAEEIGLMSKDTDRRSAEREATRLYKEAIAYIKAALKSFQEEFVELKRRLRDL
jgi:F0F1-type ATP synthase membrane subunit b/b'